MRYAFAHLKGCRQIQNAHQEFSRIHAKLKAAMPDAILSSCETLRAGLSFALSHQVRLGRCSEADSNSELIELELMQITMAATKAIRGVVKNVNSYVPSRQSSAINIDLAWGTCDAYVLCLVIVVYV